MLNNNLNNGGTMSFTKTNAVAGTTSTVTTTVATDFIINGKFGTQLDILTNQATPTTDLGTEIAFPALAINEGCAIVLGTLTAGGTTLRAVQGEIEALDADGGEFIVAASFPQVPDTMCPFAYIIIKNGSTGSAWTFGTTSFGATGITDTFVDIAIMPDRPQES
jgi:hypothetical protein